MGMVAMFATEIMSARDMLMRGHRSTVTDVVSVAHGIVAHYEAMERAGTLSREQAQSQAKEALRTFRYGDNDYVWINDLEPRVVMHPFRKDLEGQNVGELKDPKGVRLFSEFAATVKRSGEGFVAYDWPKPGVSEPVGKISFVRGFQPWGW